MFSMLELHQTYVVCNGRMWLYFVQLVQSAHSQANACIVAIFKRMFFRMVTSQTLPIVGMLAFRT